MPARKRAAAAVTKPDAEGAKPKIRKVKEAFNKLTAREWTQMSRNVWSDLSSPRDPHQLAHGAVFPVKLADRLIRMYSAPGDLVLDPFAGVGTTLVAAKRADRRAAGIELNPEFVDVASQWLNDEQSLLSSHEAPVLTCADVRSLTKHVDLASVQVTVTSPPYANFIRRSEKDRSTTHKTSRIVETNNSRAKSYSDDPRDLGNVDYDTFLEELKVVFEGLHAVTRDEGYAAWVVKDYRLPPKRPYISMHSDIARVAQDAGWLWHDLIVWDQNEQRRLILLGYPSRFYSNQNCSFIVVLRKSG